MTSCLVDTAIAARVEGLPTAPFYTLPLVQGLTTLLLLLPQGTSQCKSAPPSSPVSPSRISPRSDLSAAKSQSTSQFVTALVFNSAVFAIQVVAFTLVRPYFRAIYEPRSYIPLESFVFLSDPHTSLIT